jgi:hypothetical protein
LNFVLQYGRFREVNEALSAAIIEMQKTTLDLMQLFADNYFFEMAQVPVGVLQDACSKMEQMAGSLDKSCVKLQEAYVFFCFFPIAKKPMLVWNMV